MRANKLKINDGKTEFLLIGSKKQLNKITIDSIRIGVSEIQPATSVKNLGAVIDSNLSMEKHITNTCNAAFYHIYNIRQIRKYLNKESTERMVHFISFHFIHFIFYFLSTVAPSICIDCFTGGRGKIHIISKFKT